MKLISDSYYVTGMDYVAKNYIDMMHEGFRVSQKFYEFAKQKLDDNLEALEWLKFSAEREGLTTYEIGRGGIQTEHGSMNIHGAIECAIANTETAMKMIRASYFEREYEEERREKESA